MASDTVARHYGAFSPAERFALTVEAMARGDEDEADRLEDACPRFNYHQEDWHYRERMRRAYVITLLAMVNLQKLLALVRSSNTTGSSRTGRGWWRRAPSCSAASTACGSAAPWPTWAGSAPTVCRGAV